MSDETVMARETCWVIEHETCKHFGMLGTDRAAVEANLELVRSVGYFRWRLRELDLEPAIARYVAQPKNCRTCRMDPSRGVLASPEVVRRAFDATSGGLRVVMDGVGDV